MALARKGPKSADDRGQQPRSVARKVIVAIDGPAGAGKSTIARHLARHFGLLNLETGAMYRAFALKALRVGLPLDESSGLEALAAHTAIRLEPGEEENRVVLDGEDVTHLIRSQMVTDAASRVSVFPAIRAWMVRLQQQLGAAGGVVMEGRDIGTVVFPHADVKIFLDAAPEVRGMRRFDQLGAIPRTRKLFSLRKCCASCAFAMSVIATALTRRLSLRPMPCCSTPRTWRWRKLWEPQKRLWRHGWAISFTVCGKALCDEFCTKGTASAGPQKSAK